MINLLHTIWVRNPDLRLFQLLLNTTRPNGPNTLNGYYVEDVDLLASLKALYSPKCLHCDGYLHEEYNPFHIVFDEEDHVFCDKRCFYQWVDNGPGCMDPDTELVIARDRIKELQEYCTKNGLQNPDDPSHSHFTREGDYGG